MISQAASSNETAGRPTLRWSIAFLVSVTIALSYLDRQPLPWTLCQIRVEYPFSDQSAPAPASYPVGNGVQDCRESRFPAASPQCPQTWSERLDSLTVC